jgi:hypothetical protein
VSSTSRNRTGELVRADTFIVATRDTGYRSTSLALAELIDNAIQAGARQVLVTVASNGATRWPIEIEVTDNGSGMTRAELQQALSFGGSSRFDDRRSLGRYGMGLPNGSLSRARRLTVRTWQSGTSHVAVLDLDDVVAGRQTSITPKRLPLDPSGMDFDSGTTVQLAKCDRLEYKRASSLASRLRQDFGRIYRRFLRSGLCLLVNDVRVTPVDPLFLRDRTGCTATLFGEPLRYEVQGSSGTLGRIVVQFTELPVERWSPLPASDKRALGVTNRPNVSILRGDREIDQGWFFMGSKKRENYDDWWRCEIAFDPALDELFGLTHSKQQVTPTPELEGLLAPDLEAVARALNSRVRTRFDRARHANALAEAERRAALADARLPVLPKRRGALTRGEQVAANACVAATASDGPYRIVVGSTTTTSAYEVLSRNGQTTLVLNERHPFFRELYEPISLASSPQAQDNATLLALALLAAARTEAAASDARERAVLDSYRRSWSDVIATFFDA